LIAESGQSAPCRFENNVLATREGLKALEEGFSRSADTLLLRRKKRRLVIDVGSTEDRYMETEGARMKPFHLNQLFATGRK
jgi:hypothetical protein